MNSLKFDQVIQTAIDFLEKNIPKDHGQITLVRDSFGALSIVLSGDVDWSDVDWIRKSDTLHELLGVYSSGKRQVLLKECDLIDSSDIIDSPDRIRLPDFEDTWIVDRMLTNQDWLRKPLVERPPLPVAVAFSIKGGVGRTTALALLAWSLAKEGKNIVLVDLDLEAPGVAGLLLSESRMPDYGLIDWLVESLVGQADKTLLQECLVDCDLGRNELGRIQVLPAFGKKTNEYIDKLGRIYMPTYSSETDKFTGLAERLLMLLDQLAELPDCPDLVLLDSRAGLHDIGSAAVTRLGAEVFMFARDDYQSWQAYTQLFRHLSKSRGVGIGMDDIDLRWKLKMVGAQLNPTESAELHFKDVCYNVWSDELYDVGVTPDDEDILRNSGNPVPLVFELLDDNAPHNPLIINFDLSVKNFDLINFENRPEWRVIETAFGEFFLGLTHAFFLLMKILTNHKMTQSKFNFDAVAIRQALIDLPLTSAWENLESPKPSEIYVPLLHTKALSQDVSIVEGMRGAGKSFWTAVLADDQARKLVAGVSNIQKLSKLVVRIGFGLSLDNKNFPTAKGIGSLMGQGCTADDIWRSVLLRHLLKELMQLMPFSDDVDSAALWVKNNRNQADQYLTQCDVDLARQEKVLLLLFDSLERLADDWGHIRKILSAALQLGLECRTRRAIRLKFFLRPDMVEQEDEIWRFADSSKLLHSKEELTWRSNDLFGLILLHLANSPSVGKTFRQEVSEKTSVVWKESDGTYSLPRNLMMGEHPLRDIVEALAGAWVGNSSKRGFTFTWIPTHLSDARGRLSPRSILLAFRHAAQWTDDRHPSHSAALHYEGIQQGVVEASKIRINEIKEDYPWVGPLLEELKGATVPLTLDELTGRWSESCIQASIDAAKQKQRLPPRRYSSDSNRKGDLQALVDDLVELAILYRTEDKRLNMPDIFRVGFGIKRKGGVKLPR